MNPTSSCTQSPRCTHSPNASPSAQEQELRPSSLHDQMQWTVEGRSTFPVYSKNENEKFRKKFDEFIKKVSLQLKLTMVCLSEISPETITSPWKAFSRLVSCLENDLPKPIPLSIFTSAVAITSIEKIEASPPAKKSKDSNASEDLDLRNKTLTTAQELANIISSTLGFLQASVQFHKLKEKNLDSEQFCHAFQHALSQRLDVESSTRLDNYERELAKRIISAISPQGDAYSHAARSQLLKSATREFLKTQKFLVQNTYTNLANTNKPLPITGKSLLSVCKPYATSVVRVSANMEWLSSWQEIIFCYLARTFLQNKNVFVPHQTTSQFLLGELTPFLSRLADFPSTPSLYEKNQYITEALAKNFVRGNKGFPEIDLSLHYNEFLRCSTSITSLLKGFFILETGLCFSTQNLSNFQKYTQALHFPNAALEINNAICEASSLCTEELQQSFNCTMVLLEKMNTLLQQFISQSLAIATLRKKGFRSKSSQQIVEYEWMPEELYLSIPFFNYWTEAIWTYSSKKLFAEDMPNTISELVKTLKCASYQLKTTFRRLCYNLLIDVLEEMPLGESENGVDRFLVIARSFQTKTLPKHDPRSHLLTIAMNFIAKSEPFNLANTFLLLASQDCQKAQMDFLTCTYKFLLQNKHPIFTTKPALLDYCKSQHIAPINIPLLLEKFPFWKDCIFLCLATIFLQKKQLPIHFQGDQEPITVQDSVASATKIISRYFIKFTSSQLLMDNQRNLLTQQLAETLSAMNFEPIRASEEPSSAVTIFESKVFKNFLQTTTSFNKLLQNLFTLKTGKAFFSSNLSEFYKYANELLFHIHNSSTRKLVSRSLATSMAEKQAPDESQNEVILNVNKISMALKLLLEEAVSVLILRKQKYKSLTPKVVLETAFVIICSEICVPYTLLFSKKINLFLKKVMQTYTEKAVSEQNLNQFECTSKMYNKKAIELTHCFLNICHRLLLESSRVLRLESVAQQSSAIQKQKFIETASLICFRILLEPNQNQCILENIISFIAADKAQTNNTQMLALAIKNCFKAQENFLQFAYGYLIEHNLPLPLTTIDLLDFFKKQYTGTTVIDLPLATLPSWPNLIFYSLARIFLLKKQKSLGVDARPWDPQIFVNIIASFFPTIAKQTTGLPLESQREKFTQCLVEYFNSLRKLKTHVTDTPNIAIDPSTCEAYENLLQSALLLKELFRTCCTIKTGNDFSSQKLSEIHEYIDLLLVNEPIHHKTSVIKDTLIICSEETGSPTTQLSQLCTSLNYANSLINTIMKVSLALVMLKGTAETELTPQQTVENALTITSFPVSLTIVTKAFLNSPSGINALQAAMTEYLSGNLCIHMSEQFRLFSQETAANPLQTAIDAHLSGQTSPHIIKYMQLLSSELLYLNESLTNFCKKLCIDMKANVTSAIPEDSSEATPSQKFMITANTFYDKVTFEKHTTMPLFRSLVLILAAEYADELQKISDMAMQPPAETSTIETETNVAIWQETRDVPLTEAEETSIGQKSYIPTIPATSPEELWSTIEQILSKENWTSLLEKTEEFENLPEQETVQVEAEDFTDFLEQTKEFADLLEQETVQVAAEDFTDLLRQFEGFAESLDQETTEFEEKTEGENGS